MQTISDAEGEKNKTQNSLLLVTKSANRFQEDAGMCAEWKIDWEMLVTSTGEEYWLSTARNEKTSRTAMPTEKSPNQRVSSTLSHLTRCNPAGLNVVQCTVAALSAFFKESAPDLHNQPANEVP